MRLFSIVVNRSRQAWDSVLTAVALHTRMHAAIARAQERALKASLKFCGENVVLRYPTVIEVPHRVVIEDGVTTASFVHMWGNSGIHIGARTMIASHVAITSVTHDPHAERMNVTQVEEPVVIGHDVWIGAHAVIFPGVTIGEHAIIAAGALVRGDVPPYGVAMGSPATVIRKDRRERA